MSTNTEETSDGKNYRKNAAVIVTDGDGRVLLCERADLPGAVQTVQGGIDESESAEQAARREINEEIGLTHSQYELIGALKEPMRYTWPEEVRGWFIEHEELDRFDGQEQYFFLFKVAPDVPFNLTSHHAKEFSRVWWGTPEEMVERSWEYKREILKSALTQFGLLK